MARYCGQDIRRLFRPDAALSIPELDGLLESEGCGDPIQAYPNGARCLHVDHLLARSVIRRRNWRPLVGRMATAEHLEALRLSVMRDRPTGRRDGVDRCR